MSCIICNNNEYSVLFSAGKAQDEPILKCNSCGLMFLDNKKDYSDLQKLKNNPENSGISIQYAEKQVLQISDYKDICDFILKNKGKNAKVLEIGSNTGAFLNFLKNQGFDAKGIEPNKFAYEYAKKNFGIDLINDDLISANFKSSEFDAVVMLHVIEHLKNPCLELSEIKRVLKPGGLLVIETPSFDSLIFKFLKHRERSIRCRGHLFFFTYDTLKRLLKKNGFDVLDLKYVGRTLTVERLIHNIGIIMSSVKIKQILMSICRILKLSGLKIKINIKDMQRIYAENNKRD
ncbi:class I SAM-dependent methyltransferase [Candidatus Dependentiae bacterium]|nr:class I SAM-dependent methyltransferase [Candidatus Dependentiae bacterium]